MPGRHTPPGFSFARFLACEFYKSLPLLLGHVNGGVAHHYTKPGFFIPVLSFGRYKDFPPKGFNELSTLALSNFDISSWLLFFLLSR